MKVPLGQLAFNQKKTKLKLVKKGKRGTKESKLSLGYWLAFWEANKMCTFNAEYEILKYSKQKSNACKLQIFFRITCKKGRFP